MNERSRQSDDFARLHELVHECLSGQAACGEAERLEQWLLESDEATELYIEYIQEAVALRELLAETGATPSPGARSESLTPERAPPFEPVRLNSPAASGAAPYSPRTWRGRVGLVAAIAAASCAVLFLAVWPPSDAGSPPARMARLRQSVAATWQRDGKPLVIEEGEWFASGRYQLEQGFAQITFPWGTEITLEAPADLDLFPNETRTLRFGTLVARVSPEDTGFTIDTPAVRVVDLGTEFGVAVGPDGDSEVHVFKGEVETRGISGRADDHSSPFLRLTAGNAGSFAAEGSPARDIAFNPKRFSRTWKAASRITRTEGAIRFVHPPPRSVAPGSAESNEAVLLFLERERVRVSGVTAATLSQPGFYTTFHNRAVWLPPDVEVDSYLLHFDPVGSEIAQPPVTAAGSVTFDHPILAVVARGDQLAAGDWQFAHPDAQYFPTSLPKQQLTVIRGLTGRWNVPYLRASPAPDDRVEISDDRRTLTLRCQAGGEADQLRVLVASSPWDDSRPVLQEPPVLRGAPYRGRPFEVGETIEAEDFDHGGDGVGYYDETPDELAWEYRPGVSAELLSFQRDDQTTIIVDQTRAREWLAYTVEIERGGTYVIEASVGSPRRGGQFHIEFAGLLATEVVDVPVTGNRRQLATVQSEPIALSSGQYVMRVVMDVNHEGGWVGAFDWFRIREHSSPLDQ